VANPRLWTRFCAAMALEALERDPRFATNSARLENRAALNESIRASFATQTVDSLLDRLSAAGVPCGRVRTIEEVLVDPQLAARQMLVEIETGERVVKVPGNPVKLAGITPASGAPPSLGEHTDDVRSSVARNASKR
jgi:crotonobetainyl-CoA:carnitine CoA-transferase CaiB-like acyl-CoA transferase